MSGSTPSALFVTPALEALLLLPTVSGGVARARARVCSRVALLVLRSIFPIAVGLFAVSTRRADHLKRSPTRHAEAGRKLHSV